MNVKDEGIEVHCQPINGVYSEVTRYELGEMVSPIAKPDVELRECRTIVPIVREQLRQRLYNSPLQVNFLSQ